jgi:hypothetical protein
VNSGGTGTGTAESSVAAPDPYVFGLSSPDPVVSMDPDPAPEPAPEPSVIKQNSKKNLDSFALCHIYDFYRGTGTDPQIRIRTGTKMSRIRNTGRKAAVRALCVALQVHVHVFETPNNRSRSETPKCFGWEFDMDKIFFCCLVVNSSIAHDFM